MVFYIVFIPLLGYGEFLMGIAAIIMGNNSDYLGRLQIHWSRND